MRSKYVALLLLVAVVLSASVASTVAARTPLAYWSANRLKAYYAHDFVGIGTSNPTSNLHVAGLRGGADILTANAASVTVTPPLQIKDNLGVGKNLTVALDASIGEDLTVGEDATVGEDLTVGEDATVRGSLQVDGLSTLGAATLSGTLVVQGVGDKGPNSDHIALFSNTRPNSGVGGIGGNLDGGDGIAIQLNGMKTNSANNFLTFYNAANLVAGRVEGFSLDDNDPFNEGPFPGLPNLSFTDFIGLGGGAWNAGALDWQKGVAAFLPFPFTIPGKTNTPGDFTDLRLPSLTFPTLGDVLASPLLPGPGGDLHPKLKEVICWCIDQGLESLIQTDPAAFAIAAQLLRWTTLCKDGGTGGVTFGSTGADYAEWLPKADASSRYLPGQIVGVRDGRISLDTEKADQIMSISRAPVVIGNMPPDGDKSAYEKVAFMGQVPVLVWGPVAAGDFIVPSGSNDGFGKAVAPGQLTAEHMRQVMGRAWSSTTGLAGIVNVVVGVKTNEWAEVFERQAERVAELEARVLALESRSAEETGVEQRLARLERMLGSPKADVAAGARLGSDD